MDKLIPVEIEAATELYSVPIEQFTEFEAAYEMTGGIVPTGEIEITQNGQYDVSQYASADVNVQGGVTPTGTINITQNGQTDVTNYATANVNVQPTLQSKSATPTTSSQTIQPDVGYDGLSSVSVDAIPSEYIIPSGTKSITANGTGIDVTQYASVDVNVQSGMDFTDYVKQSATFPSGAWTYTGTSLRDYAMAYVRDNPEWQFYAPNLTYIGQNALREAQKLTEVHMPSLTTYHSTTYFCYKCPKLTLLDLGFINITSNMFAYSAKLNTLILRKTTVATINNVNAFAGTPFANGGSGGTIYIPKVLYDHLGDGSSSDYQHATNWSTVYGYGTITWAKIEGSIYE